MDFECYGRLTDREVMIAVSHGGINVNMTICRETQGSVFKGHYYEVRLMEGSRVVYLMNYGNVDHAWNNADRLREALLLGRCGK